MKKYIKISLIILAFCILSNFFILNALFNVFTDEGYYRYSNYNGSCSTEEGIFKDVGLSRPKAAHRSCLKAHPDMPDKKLYRLFWKNPLLFWRWKSYFVDERYELPYKNWKEIEAIRTTTKSTTDCIIDF